MNDPEPPSLKRTLASWRCSSQLGVGVKPYRSRRAASGGLSNVHIPSSARRPAEAKTSTKRSQSRFVGQDRTALRKVIKRAPGTHTTLRPGSGNLQSHALLCDVLFWIRARAARPERARTRERGEWGGARRIHPSARVY